MDAHGVLGREQRVFVLSSISWVGLTTVTRNLGRRATKSVRETHLARRVDDLAVVLDVSKLDSLVGSRFDGGEILLIVRRRRDELLREGCLACTRSAERGERDSNCSSCLLTQPR